ncbi:MAG: LPS export ABC transporter periplasmic protein LptC [Bacteroidia bacterium]
MWGYSKYNFSLQLAWLLMLILFATSCQKDPEKVKKVSKIISSIGVEKATDVAINYTDSGFLKAKIFSPLIERYPQKAEPYMEMKKGVRGFFYNKAGEAESSLTANYAISYENKKIIEVRNNVKVKNIRAEELETEKLIWDQRREIIYTDNFIKIKTPDEILYGTGFESNQNFTRYRIKNLTGRVSIK